jgi:zinc transporter ZupT
VRFYYRKEIRGESNPSFSYDSSSTKTSSSTLTTSPADEKQNKNNNSDPADFKAKEKSIMSAIRSFVIVLALSIHAIFEGMAIGKFFHKLWGSRSSSAAWIQSVDVFFISLHHRPWIL